MKIEHIALWTAQLETMKNFYCQYFGAEAGEKYVNPDKNFASYFLAFDSGARLELMQMTGILSRNIAPEKQQMGYVHMAIATGSKAAVDELTEQLRSDGYTIADEPRTTGDGYYESVVFDPDGNRIEITI